MSQPPTSEVLALAVGQLATEQRAATVALRDLGRRESDAAEALVELREAVARIEGRIEGMQPTAHEPPTVVAVARQAPRVLGAVAEMPTRALVALVVLVLGGVLGGWAIWLVRVAIATAIVGGA